MAGKVKAVNDFGLDKELAEKAAAKYDHKAEMEAQQWIEKLTGIKFDKEFGEMLKDGVVLCHLINAIEPGKVPTKRIYTGGKMPFKMMENITTFIKYARGRGVGESELFTTVALFESKDLGQVVLCLHAFARIVQSSRGYSGPMLGKAVKPKGKLNPARKTNHGASVSKLNEGSHGKMKLEVPKNPYDQFLGKGKPKDI